MKNYQNDPNLAKFLAKLKKIEPFLLALSLLGFVAIMQAWPITPFVFIFSTSTLIFYYFYKGLAAVTPSKDIFERFAGTFIFFSLAIGLMAFEFHVLSWPGWMLMSMTGLMGIMLCFMILVFKQKSITEFLGIYELCSLVLVMVYLGKIFYLEMGN